MKDLQDLKDLTPLQLQELSLPETLQGYLAQNEPPPPLAPPYEPRHGHTVGFYGVALSFNRGTRVPPKTLTPELQTCIGARGGARMGTSFWTAVDRAPVLLTGALLLTTPALLTGACGGARVGV